MLISLEVATGLLGLFLAFPLIAMRRNRPANVWLGLFILSVSLLSLAFPVYSYFPQLFGLFDWPLAGVGAFFYCYVCSLTGLGHSHRQRYHFLPLALFVSVLVVARSRLSGIEMLRWLVGGAQPVFGMLLLGFQMLAAGYALAALYRLSQYRQRLREHYSSIENRQLTWLSWLSMSFFALLILWIPANLFHGFWNLLLIIGRLLTLYFVGWYGLRQTAVWMARIDAGESSSQMHVANELALAAAGGDEKASTTQPAEMAFLTNAPPSGIADLEQAVTRPIDQPLETEGASSNATDSVATHRYARSGMTESVSQLIGERFDRWVAQERGYLHPDISLSDLAERIGTSSQLLSQYLNEVRGTSFFDCINALRVAEVQKMMRDPGNDARTLLELAFAAGFNSKSTFNTSFKKISDLAPSAWRNRYARTSGPIG